eukprot:g33575.t1
MWHYCCTVRPTILAILVQDSENPGTRRLLVSGCSLWPHSRPQCLTKISPNALRQLSLTEAPALFLPGGLWMPLISASLRYLSLSLERPELQEPQLELWTSLEEAQHLRRLQLSGLRFSPQLLCQGLRRLKCLGQLRHLGLGHCSADALVSEAGDEMLELLAVGLGMVLKLESDVGQLQLILETLSAPQLLQLDLSFNAQAQEALLRPLNAILESRPLTKLNLTGSAFCLSSLTALPSSLEELRIAGCHVPLGPEGGELLQRFLQNCENLQVLELGSIGQVQPWLRRSLLALLRSCAPLLRRLQAKLPGNLLQEPAPAGFSGRRAGLSGVCERAGLGGPFETGTFLCSLPLLEWLDLEPGGPLPSSFPALLAAPRASLRVLRVAHALLSDGLGSELVKRLRGAGALQQLSLVDCGLGANTVGSFLVPLPSWPQLTHLNLSHNGFAGAQATTPLLKTLSVSRRLRQLRLCACELDMDSALVACAPLVVGLPGLDLLDLRGNARPSEDACLSFIATARQEFARGTFSPWPSGAPPASLELECEVGQLPEKLGRFQLRCHGDNGVG